MRRLQVNPWNPPTDPPFTFGANSGIIGRNPITWTPQEDLE